MGACAANMVALASAHDTTQGIAAEFEQPAAMIALRRWLGVFFPRPMHGATIDQKLATRNIHEHLQHLPTGLKQWRFSDTMMIKIHKGSKKNV